MKRVTVKSKYMSGSWLLIKNMDDLDQYMSHTSGEVVQLVSALIKDNVPKERWDHCITRNNAGSILAATLVKCKTQGKSPIMEIDSMMFAKFKTMHEFISNGEQLLVNDLGGFCQLAPDCEIVDEQEVDLSFQPTYTVKPNTTYINLENDPKLEKHTEQYLGAIDPNYSFILNLGLHNQEQLTKIFREFARNGGKIVYVYTTGMKVSQMYEYFEAAKKAGLKEFEFEFNAGITPEIQEFVDFAGKKAKVVYKEV